MGNNNMSLWEKVKKPPKEALKTIGAGRLKGMTDINPQWRLQAMTENFGMAGVGWHYEIVKLWTEAGASGEVMCFVHLHLHVRDGEAWSMPIVGIGGSALVAKETTGLRANDEGWKMALTDALSVAMKQLGVASAIYEGLWDGSKYKDEEAGANRADIDALANCATMQSLEQAYSALLQRYKGQKVALSEIVAAKDLAKERLSHAPKN